MKPTILIVDDNDEILEFLTIDLQENYNLLRALNGEQALIQLQKNTIKLVISDVMMPVMDGFELCRKIKSNLSYSHIPVILLTAKDTIQSKIEGLELGADVYIEKPFSPKHLKVQILSLLKNRENIREYYATSPLAYVESTDLSKADEIFLKKLDTVINNNLENVTLDIGQLSDFMNLSRPTLYRKIKALSDLSPNEMINMARLKKATEILVEGEHKIFTIAGMVGFKSQSYFSRLFFKQFGITPSEYLQNLRGAAHAPPISPNE